ncbi:MAG: hypothetical protein Q9M28_08255 [Mariprofundaceae bacterium]|nr:hypothetical protein [Mariprofundaceae bacterium]
MSQFITDHVEDFHDEKSELLQAGLAVSEYIHTDDTTMVKMVTVRTLAMNCLLGSVAQKVKAALIF